MAIYLNEKIEAEKICELSHRKCEVVAVQIQDLKTINIVVYRPPGTKGEEFNIIIDEIERLLKNKDGLEPIVILSRDFNFPFVNWKRTASG